MAVKREKSLKREKSKDQEKRSTLVQNILYIYIGGWIINHVQSCEHLAKTNEKQS